jgi:periplasmic protein TonB
MLSTSERPGALNGANEAGVVRASFSGAAVYDDPMSKVLGLDAKTSGFAAWFGFTSGSTALLAGLMALASVIAVMHAARARSEALAAEEIEIIKEDPPPPPPQKEEAKPEPAPPPPRPVAHETPPPPPAPAQAAKVLAQEPDPNDPVDLTGNTIVQGNADSYAGGFTTSTGRSATAVNAMPSPTGVVGGTGPVKAAGPDRSRRASLGGKDWNTPWPSEADAVQMDEASVMIEVDVRADGTAGAVRVLKDPGYGFGREARRYALTQHYEPALDHDGNAIPQTIGFKVHFTR